MKTKREVAWAKALVRGIEQKRRVLARSEKAAAAYWNCDSWGSISGIRDAAEWMESNIVAYVLKHARPRKARP